MRESLSAIGIEVESIICPICHSHVETVDHVFAECHALRPLYIRIDLWWDLEVLTYWSISTLTFWLEMVPPFISQRKVFDAVVVTAFWILWKFRNASVLGTVAPKKSTIFNEVVTIGLSV